MLVARRLPRTLLRAVQCYKMSSSARVVPSDVVPLSEAHKAAVAATAPVLAEHGVAITTRMYNTMLRDNPELRNIFSNTAQKSGDQPRALAGAVHAYAANIHDLSPLLPTVTRIAEKHVALGVEAEHYSTVGENLIPAISHVLGPAFTPELKEAWYQAYWQLAKIFIDVEADMYAKGAWQGWKEFKITRHTKESETISSLELVPTDATMLPLKPFKAGQFITVRAWIEELHCFQNRHYSLSDASCEDHYRISVKREDATDVCHPAGLVSSYLHHLPEGSFIRCAFPAGSFVLPETLPENLVLFSAGVGITPNISILNTVSAKDPAGGPNVSWIQGCRTAAEHIFKAHVDDIASRSEGKVRTAAFYTKEEPDGDGLHSGKIQVSNLDKSFLALDDQATQYFVCGPDSFMQDIRRDLESLGIDRQRIHIEAFHAGEV